MITVIFSKLHVQTKHFNYEIKDFNCEVYRKRIA